MRRYLIGIVTVGLALTACGGGDSGPLAADDVVPKLEAAGLDCTETSSEAVQESIAATAVTCALGEAGGIVVIVADSSDDLAKAQQELCSQVDPAQGNLDLASGDYWLSVTLSTVGVGATQVADALGGKATKIKEFCA
jgi:uncharacterized protein YbjT (DUF2867 family)